MSNFSEYTEQSMLISFYIIISMSSELPTFVIFIRESPYRKIDMWIHSKMARLFRSEEIRVP